MKDNFESRKMLYISLIILVFIFIYHITNRNNDTEQFNWFLRVVTALAAAAMSMSLSGSINIGKDSNMKTFAEASPKITAAGSFAVFVIVYLFKAGSIG
ncbi:hypothetical protein AB9K26_06710 [Psychroserpens sp. XS_ASV72]|uniref:hypothetical protein n=1 Tax=Psychroserpens sp. XS_ASV72 TaxID=3241293 RepID=UPI003514E241